MIRLWLAFITLQLDAALCGERRHAFETDLRRLLQAANPTGIFGEQLREIAADIWRPRDD
jgi:hypothetical protein